MGSATKGKAGEEEIECHCHKRYICFADKVEMLYCCIELPTMYTYMHLKMRKRMRVDRGMTCLNPSNSACWREELEQKKRRLSAKVIDYSDSFTISNVLEELDSGKYGSVTKDIEDLISRSQLLLSTNLAVNPTLSYKYLGSENYPSEEPLRTNQSMSIGVINVEDDCDANRVSSTAVCFRVTASPSSFSTHLRQ